MKRTLLLTLVALMVTGLIWAQSTVYHECVPTFTELPAGWTANNGGGVAIFQAATGGYLLVDHIDDWVITSAYDLSGYSDLQLVVDIASYGSGDFNPLTIDVSNDNGVTWTHQTFITNPTTGTTYQTEGPYSITADGTQVMFRFWRNAAAGRGVRFRNIHLTGVPDVQPVEAPYFNPPAGEYYAAFDVAILCDTENSTIYYSTDSDAGPWNDYLALINITETTTIWAYAIAAGMTDSPVVSATYTIPVPATTTIPYEENFETGLGHCYPFSVSGATRVWNHYAAGQIAQMNGFGSDMLEEDWLILPGITLDNDDFILTFDSWRRYGLDNVDNYFQLLYSTDYYGVGDPSAATWLPLAFDMPAADQVWTSSGNIDLSGIVGDPVYLAFKYHYNVGMYVWWQIDNINIYEATTPMITADPSDLTGQLSYVFNESPATLLSTVVEVVNVYGSYSTTALLTLTDSDFEIAKEDNGTRTEFGSEIVIPGVEGYLTFTLLVRMKAGLPVGYYSDNIEISVDSGIVDPFIIPVDGEVFPTPPEGYYIDFELGNFTFISGSTGYASGIYDLNGYQWELIQALIGNLAGDKKFDDRSLRMRRDGETLGEFMMIEDKPDGLGTISFYYAHYGTEVDQPILTIQYSINQGASWIDIGAIAVFPDELTLFSADVNVPGDVRVRFITDLSGTNQRRFNLDNILMTSFEGEPPLPVELSSFTATFTTTQFVELQWISETETNLLGYNVYRNIDNSLNDSEKVNSLVIPAGNESTQ